MKKHLFGMIASTLFVLALLTVCKNDAGSGPGSGEDDQKIIVMGLSREETGWDYLAVGSDGSSMAFNVNETTGLPTRLTLKPKKNSDDTITYLFKENGLPDMMLWNGYIVYFGNYSGYEFDMAIIRPDGQEGSDTERSVNGRSVTYEDIEYHLQTQSEYDFDGWQPNSNVWDDVLDNLDVTLNTMGNIMGTVTCCTAVFFPPSFAGCTIFLLSTVASEVVDIVYGDSMANDVQQILLSALGCATLDPVDCASTAVGIISVLSGKDLDTLNDRTERDKVNEAIRVIAGDAYVPVSSVTVSPSSISLAAEGTTATLTATIYPPDATTKLISWSTSNEYKVDVSQNWSESAWGIIRTRDAGTATITVTTLDGGLTASCTVTVTPAIAVESVTLDKTTLSLAERQTEKLTATVWPANASHKETLWSSSNNNIATVDGYGNVRGEAVGTATITVTTLHGDKTATCAVTVTPRIAVTGVALDKTTLSLTAGQTETLTATVSPPDATDKKTRWASSDRSVATVDEGGVVTAVSAGTATVTVTSEDGSRTATCAVTVSHAVGGGIMTWTEASCPISVTNIAYGNGKFIAVGDGDMAQSTDGKTWTAIPLQSFSYRPDYLARPSDQIVFGNGKFVAISGGLLLYSTNGTSWSQATLGNYGENFTPTDSYGHVIVTYNWSPQIAYGDGRFVIAGPSLNGGIWSDDGIVWHDCDYFPDEEGTDTFDPNAFAFGGGKFVAGGWGDMAWSADGKNWTYIPVGTGPGKTGFPEENPYLDNVSIVTIAYGNGKFVVWGEAMPRWDAPIGQSPYLTPYGSGRLAWSTDGSTWTAIEDGGGLWTPSYYPQAGGYLYPAGITTIAFGGGKFVAGYGATWSADSGDVIGGIAYSEDGLAWTAVTDHPFGKAGMLITAIAYGNGIFVAADWHGVAAWSKP